jgi:hypothetical protein
MAVSAYSYFPPVLIAIVGSFIVMYFKPAEDISYFQSQAGLLKLNPTMFLDVTGALGALLNRIDLLAIWGMFLSAIGLQNCFKISSGAGLAISFFIWLIGTTIFVLMGMFFG